MRPAKFPYLVHDGILAFAHRGGASDGPENTMSAFQSSVDAGYSYVETDVHCTKDGVLLAFHDDILDRVTDGKGRIAEMNYVDVEKVLVDGKEPIPKLDEIFHAWPDLKLNIDPKNDNAIDALAEAILRADAVDRVGVGSFSDSRIDRIRKLVGEGLCTSPGPKGTTKLRAGSIGLPSRKYTYGCVQVPVKHLGLTIVDRKFVDFIHAQEMQVHVWTIDDPDEMRRLVALGVDGIMTDRKEVLRATLIELGEWV